MRALCNLGNVFYGLDQYGDALDNYSRALTIAREIGNDAHEDILLNNIGNLYLDSEDFGRAAEFYERALQRTPGELTVQLNLGIAHYFLREYARAIELQESVLASAREQGNRGLEAHALESLGDTRDATGETPLALRLHREALAVRREIGDEGGVATSQLRIGKIASKLGDRPVALSNLESALRGAEALGARDCVAETHHALSQYYRDGGDYPRALEHHENFHNVKVEIIREQSEKRVIALGIELSAERNVHEAEVTRLKGRIQELAIEIDYARRDKQLAEVVESDSFLALKARAKELRRRMAGGSGE